ncbi:hypothetical protein O181_056942 [Austropuccinia psidii MF-1]|uniref:Uncharacterized protein n=1 Tax=Austropuccinia psidii MF-1 TaxID=1389203 RepID=A0A9Q3HUY2_9BASI|nr:hypothetical protein [Austropuccinia psidii MF-1]
MQQAVAFNHTYKLVSMDMSSTTSTLCTNSTSPQLLLNTQSNYLPYSLPSTIFKPPVPSTIPLEIPTTPPIITEEDIPKHPPNVTPKRSSQHESPHLNNDQYLEVQADSIPNSPAQVHPLTPTNEIIDEVLHVAIVENNSSPNFPSQIPSNTTTENNAMTPHVVSSPRQINHVQSSHTLSAPHFENPKTIF